MNEPKAPTVDPLSMFRVSAPDDEPNKEEQKKDDTPPESKKPEK